MCAHVSINLSENLCEHRRRSRYKPRGNAPVMRVREGGQDTCSGVRGIIVAKDQRFRSGKWYLYLYLAHLMFNSRAQGNYGQPQAAEVG